MDKPKNKKYTLMSQRCLSEVDFSEMIRLIDEGADVNTKNCFDNILLDYAVMRGRNDVAEELIRQRGRF